jgi:predicted TIM-barrel fold metal-dependent hydrolase
VDIPLIDHHVHGVVTGNLDQLAFESLLTEGGAGALVPGMSAFDSQLGIAVRRWCAPVLGLEPLAQPQMYLTRRDELGAAEVTRRFLRAAGVGMWLVDTGYQTGDGVCAPAELAAASGAQAREIVRLEALAERVLRDGTSADGFGSAFEAALAEEISAIRAVGLKSIAAYRHGLEVSPSRPSTANVAMAAGRELRALALEPGARVHDEILLAHLIWTGIDAGLPLQFHCGFGDPDVRLHRADPSLLHDFLIATRAAGVPVVLLHCYPFHRQAGYLANVFPHVYADIGEALNHVGARSAAVLAEALELTPLHKMMYSSDAFGLPELHYLGAAGFRRDIQTVTSAFVADGAWSEADAGRAIGLIGWQNAARVYQLSL